jgi:hypothetical protein
MIFAGSKQPAMMKPGRIQSMPERRLSNAPIYDCCKFYLISSYSVVG